MKRYLITGGCGFVGSNLTSALLADGHAVTVFDNLSRRGTERNRDWLLAKNDPNLTFIRGDIRNFDEIRQATASQPFDVVIHTAGQVAVTTSVTDPREDFMINALGTFNVLEAVRALDRRPALLLTSTNKVYGGMEEVKVVERNGRYEYESLPEGVSEEQPLDFHSPYGCSKGTADQYVRDYARIYDIPTVVFRMSCQYGPRQFGNEDQGWVAHFVIAAEKGRDITIYGDGKQVRDILAVEDLVDAFLRIERRIGDLSAQAFNVGGGPANTVSLLQVLDTIEQLTGRAPEVRFAGWRPGDQRYYCSDTRKLQQAVGWQPQVDAVDGIRRLHGWLLNSYVVDRQPADQRLAL